MKIAIAAQVPAYEQGKEPGRSGHSSRPGGSIGQVLLQDHAPDDLNFRLRRNQFQSGDKAFTSPRHCHTFQQIRFAERGSVNFAPGQSIHEGDIAFFPRGAYYGPQVKDQGISVALQYGFGGEHQEGPIWDQYRAEALARLKSRGTFQNGSYIDTDPITGEDRQRDSLQALYEEQYLMHTNEKLRLRPTSYEAPVLMHPRAFAYYPAGQGIEIKQLGRFYDCAGPDGDVGLAMVRISDGSAYTFDSHRAQIAWSISAGLGIEGKTYPELTCLYSPRGEEAMVKAEATVELFVVNFPVPI
jgi:hypothetical protein